MSQLQSKDEAVNVINARNSDGRTPLHLAAENGHHGSISPLIKLGADNLAKDSSGRTPLHLAAESGALESIRALIDSTAPADSTTLVDSSLLRKAVATKDDSGQTPLHLAAKNGHLESLDVLAKANIVDVLEEDNFGQTPLHLAVLGDHSKVVERLCELEKEIVARGKGSQTPLHLAAKSGHLKSLRILIKSNKLQVMAKDSFGRTPLHVAVINGNLEIVRDLVEAGAGVSTEDENGVSPIALAIRENSSDALSILMGSSTNETIRDSQGRTPLHLAAYAGRFEIIRKLINLELDAAVNQQLGNIRWSEDKDKSDDSLSKIWDGYQAAVERLLGWQKEKLSDTSFTSSEDKGGSSSETKQETPFSGQGVTATPKAEQTPDPPKQAKSTAQFVVEKSDPVSIFKEVDSGLRSLIPTNLLGLVHPGLQAVLDTTLDEIMKLLETKAGHENSKKKPISVLVSNAHIGHYERKYVVRLVAGIVLYLRMQRNNSFTKVDVEDNYMQTPLHLAAAKRDTKSIQTLLDFGAQVNRQDGKGQTPLHGAAAKGSPMAVEALLGSRVEESDDEKILKYGAEINLRDQNGQTPLHLAVANREMKVVRILLDPKNAAEVNPQDNQGKTPLHIAVEKEDEKAVALLLTKGSSIDRQDKNGQTPLHVAVESGKRDITLVMLDSESEINLDQKDNQQRTPLLLLVEKKRKDIPEAKPIFPIQINGNDLDNKIRPELKAEATNYIVVQTQVLPSPSQRRTLAEAEVEILNYVSECTYLCRYQDTSRDLNRIRQIYPVVYVDIYRQEFKITPSLNRLRKTPDLDIDVYVIFHDHAEEEGKKRLQELFTGFNLGPSEGSRGRIDLYRQKARLNVPGRYLNEIANIDEVRWIEEVGRVQLYSRGSRVILGLDDPIGVGPVYHSSAQGSSYEGQGEVIAIADTGLGDGSIDPHHAFTGRIEARYNLGSNIPGDNTPDNSGHGTHVCGSAVGNGELDLGGPGRVRIKGTAPEARLVVQSLIKDGFIESPDDLADGLFRIPYEQHNVRVHSNSWGLGMEEDGKVVQKGYTRDPDEIDDFIWRNQDMVICWAAGNDGRRSPQGQVGAEAIAKNCITIGACGKVPLSRKGRQIMADFSSSGPPVAERRVINGIPILRHRYKPDIVAPGDSILSARSSLQLHPDARPLTWNNQQNQHWCYMDGTSMATPLVAGCAAVLIQAFKSKNNQRNPSAALVKALLINGAKKLEVCDGPSIASGYGRVDLARSIRIACNRPGTGIWESNLDKGNKRISASETIGVRVPAQYNALKVTLVWPEPSGHKIHNHLRLYLQHGDGLSNNSKSSSLYNNVQQIEWRQPRGKWFDQNVTIEVEPCSGQLNLPWNIQKLPFAVVWELSSR
ncbi:hypothetical protein TWF506_000283 [Arthrobotrys conoides]|uniref:Peptidase S8/S53 domain-containing protein n=1 Tax=Arthrobotrys conoides TaxID=74498 RepID=A0AAN8S451_9PEZI